MVPWGGAPVQKPWLKQNQRQQYSPQWRAGPVAPYGGKGGPAYGGGSMYGGDGWGFAPPQQRRPRAPPPRMPEHLQINATMRYTGVVAFYHKWKGYGFVEVSQKGVVPKDQLFCHWRQINSDDRFPFLVKGLEVEFNITPWMERGIKTVRAKDVTMPGGMNIGLQDDLDAQEKSFIGGQHLRYTGTLKFFAPKLGFGFVVMDQGYDVDPSVPMEMRVETAEVNAGGRHPVHMENIPVEFGIWRTQRGLYKVYNMTLPGGHPLTQDALENRISMGTTLFRGSVGIWNWRQGWGFIRADPAVEMPPRVLAKLAQQVAAARARGRVITEEKMLYFRKPDCWPGVYIRQGSQVEFQLYIDDKGAGACEVHEAQPVFPTTGANFASGIPVAAG